MKILDPDKLKDNIERIAAYDFKLHKVFGSAYCVLQNDDIVYQKCFGHTSPLNKEAVTDKTLFRLASMTKPITAVAVLTLVESGKIGLRDPITRFLPDFEGIRIKQKNENGEFVDSGAAKREITVMHLLNHTSGIGSDFNKCAGMTAEDKRSIDRSLEYYRKSGLDFEPGSRQQYSATAAFNVLVKIAETVTQKDYLEFLTDSLFKPCGMTDTTFLPTKEQYSRLIAMHDRQNGENTVGQTTDNCIFSDVPCTHYLGGAGLVSTLSDYTKFAKMLSDGGKAENGRVLSAQTLSLMSTPSVSKNIMPENERWGLGVRVITEEAYKVLPCGSFGWSGAYGSHFWVDPQNRVVAVFMKNSFVDGGSGNESARNFERAVHEAYIPETHR